MKLQKRILLIFLIFMVIFTVKSFALSEGDTVTFDGITTEMPKTYNEDEVNEDENPLYLKQMQPSLMSVDTSNDISSLISKYEISGDTAIGIDVSSHNGVIDWKKVKDSGVKFVMIRVGYRGYGSDGKLAVDSQFENNIKGALDNEIYVGIYFVPTALNEEESLQEAAFVVDTIKNYDIKYPIAYDFEYFGDRYDPNSGNPYRTNGLSNEQLNANAKVFLNYIRSQGYTPSLYGSSSYLNSTWDSEVRSNNDVWVAHYGASKPSYTGSYTMWQYTSSGSVPGINANVDIDIDYSYYMNLNNIDITNYLFDATYYADKYSDLKKAFGYNKSQLKSHWLNFGIKEGRTASPVYDPAYYVNKYSDLKSAYKTDYEALYNHFINFGINEGRVASKYFDVNYYISNNSDVKKAYYSSKSYSLVHFMTFGINEGRVASSSFNVISYYNSQSSYTKKQLGTTYIKYFALADGGSPINDSPIDITNYLFDAKFYADKYSDLKEAFGYNESLLKQHYEEFGKREGRSASPVFDPVYYINKYSDLKSAFGKDYVSAYNHFINFGIDEGRQASSTFNVVEYINNYSDLKAEFGPNFSKALQHYMQFGINEGRIGV